ncbi:MAG: hypothetical protein Q7R33_02065 [Nitrosarchaeum sp.]|nr:hypothetical protein [Nitrosarchaeum sp.]
MSVQMAYCVTRKGTREIVHTSGTVIPTNESNTPTDEWILNYVVDKVGGLTSDYSIWRLEDDEQINKINSHRYNMSFNWNDNNEIIGITLVEKPI